MLQNIRATAVTVSELLRKNEQEGWVGGGGWGVLSPTQFRVKKQSKLNCSIYHLIFLLSHIDKNLDVFMFNRLYEFLGANNLVCDLEFGLPQKHSFCVVLIQLTTGNIQEK